MAAEYWQEYFARTGRIFRPIGQVVPLELQADCMAGAYIGDSVRRQRLLLDPGDLDGLRAGLLTVVWFFTGFARSLDACAVDP